MPPAAARSPAVIPTATSRARATRSTITNSTGLRIPGMVMDITEAKSSEHNLRNLYRRWSEFMEAESWDELATWRRAEQDHGIVRAAE